MNPEEQFEAQCADANAYADSQRMPAEQLAEQLRMFSGTDHIYRQQMLGQVICYTDGVKFLAEAAQAYWLIDAIHSHQRRAVRLCDGFQIWHLDVAANRSAVLTCRSDSDQKPAITQRLEYTDFPMAQLKLYVVGHTIMLPGEY